MIFMSIKLNRNVAIVPVAVAVVVVVDLAVAAVLVGLVATGQVAGVVAIAKEKGYYNNLTPR